MSFAEARKLVTHPVACIDCHDPKTMQLRVSRPGFIEGMRAIQSRRGREGLRREPRCDPAGRCAALSAVSATWSITSRDRRSGWSIPWAERIEGRTNPGLLRRGSSSRTGRTRKPARRCSRRSIRNSSCGTRAFTRAPAWPAQIVTCLTNARARSRSAIIMSRSPLLNINRACQTCHKWPESELKARVEAIQERTQSMRNLAMDALVELIGDLKAARARQTRLPNAVTAAPGLPAQGAVLS